MSDFLKNLRNNQQGNNSYNQKQYDAKYKGQQPRQNNRQKQGGGQQAKDIPPYLKALFDDLAPALKQFLQKTVENQERLAAVNEKNAEALTKIAEALPDYIRSSAPPRKMPRRRKIDANKQKTLDLIKRLRDENLTYEEVAAYLDENNVPTFSGRGRWHAQTIHRLYMYYP